MWIRLADLAVRIENPHAYTKELCRDYICANGPADFTVNIQTEDILAEECGAECPEYAESLAVYRKIAEKILEFDGFLLHGVVLETEGEGVAFLAKSGVGKSTHAAFWKALLGEKVTYINGDKPLVRMLSGTPYAYGTPWAGKEGLQKNTRTPLRKICFLERGTENSVTPLSRETVLFSLLPQIYLPKDGESLSRLLELLSAFIEKIDFYAVCCTPDISAAEVCHRALFGKSE